MPHFERRMRYFVDCPGGLPFVCAGYRQHVDRHKNRLDAWEEYRIHMGTAHGVAVGDCPNWETKDV